MAFFAAVADKEEHAEKTEQYNDRQLKVQHDQHDKGACDQDAVLDQGREAVVQCI